MTGSFGSRAEPSVVPQSDEALAVPATSCAAPKCRGAVWVEVAAVPPAVARWILVGDDGSPFTGDLEGFETC